MVTGTAWPDDPDLRRRSRPLGGGDEPPLDSYTCAVLARQDGRRPICCDDLLSHDQPQSPQEWERWWLSVARRAIAAEHLLHQDGRGTPDRTEPA